MDTVNNISRSLNSVLENVYNNKVANAVIGLFLVLYAGLAAPKLPKSIAKIFGNKIVKLVILFLVAFMASKNTSVAIIAAVALTISLQTLSYHETSNKLQKIVKKEANKYISEGEEHGESEEYSEGEGEGKEYSEEEGEGKENSEEEGEGKEYSEEEGVYSEGEGVYSENVESTNNGQEYAEHKSEEVGETGAYKAHGEFRGESEEIQENEEELNSEEKQVVKKQDNSIDHFTVLGYTGNEFSSY